MLVWMMLWISGALGQRDMRGKLFRFPEQSSTSYVQIFPDRKGPYTEASVCMRFYSDRTRGYALFSLATHEIYNALLLYNSPQKSNPISLAVNDKESFYEYSDNHVAKWTILCASFRSSGSVLFINGKTYRENQTENEEISTDPIIIIGQDQDSYGGGFNKYQSLVGEMTDINMWDKALTDEDMMDYFADGEISGNIINWKALNYTIVGNVIIGPYDDPFPCFPV